jgi:hypothetical protein
MEKVFQTFHLQSQTSQLFGVSSMQCYIASHLVLLEWNDIQWFHFNIFQACPPPTHAPLIHTHTHTWVFNNFLKAENPHLTKTNLLCLDEQKNKAINIWKYFVLLINVSCLSCLLKYGFWSSYSWSPLVLVISLKLKENKIIQILIITLNSKNTAPYAACCT